MANNASLLRLFLTAYVVICVVAQREPPNYARIQARKRDNRVQCCDQLLPAENTGVFALYGPRTTVNDALVVVADPPDGCSPLPEEKRPDVKFVILARLTATSQCTYVEQGRNAELSGAAALINMADFRTSYIYLMERQQDDLDDPVPSIPSVAISGLAGQNLTVAARQTDVLINLRTQEELFENPLWIHLIIYLIAVTVLALVVILVSQIARRYFKRRAAIRRARARRAQAKTMLKALPVSHMEDNVDDSCAVCLDDFCKGDKVRTLPCDHFFHKSCIDPWLKSNHNCPLCKFDIIEKQHPTVETPASALSDAADGQDVYVPRQLIVNLNHQQPETVIEMYEPDLPEADSIMPMNDPNNQASESTGLPRVIQPLDYTIELDIDDHHDYYLSSDESEMTSLDNQSEHSVQERHRPASGYAEPDFPGIHFATSGGWTDSYV